MLKRLKNVWDSITGKNYLTKDEMAKLLTDNPEIAKQIKDKLNVVEGDGKAEFFGPGTEEEFEEQDKEDKGLKGIFGL